jgi:WhiB family redox-sensing transcriptional regulator
MTDTSRLPTGIQDSWNWQSRGACRDAGTDQFFHPEFERGRNREDRVAAAKVLCARCPVVTACAEYALAAEEPYGTWGGVDELERAAVIKARRRRARAAG